MANTNIINVSQDNFKTTVLEAKQPVLVDFWAEWCGPCKMMNPIIEEVAREYASAGKLIVAKCDVDNNQELAVQYNVRGIPALILFKNGEVQASHIGTITKIDLDAFIETNI